jgi:diaminopimelate epimerase
MKTISFTKMHGLGNDHIVIDLFKQDMPDPQNLAPRMCNRHLGIGADGLILIYPSEKYDFRMRVINADGSEAEMCGNGIRCLARYVVENGLTDKTEFITETLRGPHHQKVNLARGKFADVTTNMGSPILERSKIPMVGKNTEKVVNEELIVDGVSYHITLVNVGNPHCVVFTDDIDSINLLAIGPKFEHHPAFPNRINTEFVKVLDKNNVRMRVWERGSGETFACGTGATAAVVASILNNLTYDTVMVHFKYGDLTIEWKNHGELYMTGSATTVYTGEYKI